MNIFSLPLSPYMSEKDYSGVYLPFVQKYAEYIYDIYATVRIAPFNSDAMGGAFDANKLIEQALRVQKDTNKTVSATFNDITVPATQENLHIFIKNFTPLYEVGIRSITLSQIHWMLSGELFVHFPKLKIKNSVLNKIDNAQSYWDSALAGYVTINVDRKLLRDMKSLKEIKKAKILFASKYGYAPLIQILANEHCIGLCPVMDEHYSINITQGDYGSTSVSNFSCKTWKTLDKAYSYRKANISPYYEDIKEILNYVDILKLHGRGGTALIQESMQIIGDFALEKSLFDFGSKMFENKNEATIKQWRKTIKECRFQCWSCNVCDEIA